MTNNRGSLERESQLAFPSSEFRPAHLQRRSYLIALTLAVVGLVVTLINIFRAPQQEQRFSLQELSYSQVISLFDNGAPEIIISHTFGTDTLRKDSDYILLRDKIASRLNQDGITSVADIDPDPAQEQAPWSTEPEEEILDDLIPTLRLDVSGARAAGSKLNFLIEEYDPSIFYYLDFGDGYRRKIDRESVFTYSKPGIFTVQLYASIPEKGIYKSYSKDLYISQSSSFGPPPTTSSRPSYQKPIPTSRPDNSVSDLIAKNEKELEFTDGGFIEVDEEKKPEEEVQVSDLGLSENSEEENSSQGTGNLSALNPNEDPEIIIGTSLQNPQAINTPYFDAEMMPEFPGGIKAMGRYLKKNAQYPDAASRAGIEGTVNVRLVVQSDGSISDLKVLKGLGYGCDDEAIRLVSQMPKWIPGVQNGVSVPVYTVIPITFRLIN